MSAEERLAMLAKRRDQIRQWLAAQASFAGSDQKHLDADTSEQAYWHHGYQSALDDVIELLK